MQNKFFVKSVYLAFAFCPNIQPDEDSDQLEMIQAFQFSLTKGNDIISKSQKFSLENYRDGEEIYLYLSVPEYRLGSSQKYTLGMQIIVNGKEQNVYEKQIDLVHYINDYEKDRKMFWTEINQFKFLGNKIILMNRIFLKKSREELQKLVFITYQGTLNNQDDSNIRVTLSQISKESKDNLKNSSTKLFRQYDDLPIRLSTISEEDSAFFSNIKKRQVHDFDESDFRKLQVKTPEVRKFQRQQQEDFWEYQNDKIDSKFLNFDSQQVFQAIQNVRSTQPAGSLPLNQNNFRKSKRQLKSRKTLQMPKIAQSQLQNMQGNKNSNNDSSFLQVTGSHLAPDFEPKGSKLSKKTKQSQRQHYQLSVEADDNDEINSVLNRSYSFRSNLSQLSIDQEQHCMFKLKYVLFIILIVSIALVATISDHFNINVDEIVGKRPMKNRSSKEGKKREAKGQGKKHQNIKSKKAVKH